MKGRLNRLLICLLFVTSASIFAAPTPPAPSGPSAAPPPPPGLPINEWLYWVVGLSVLYGLYVVNNEINEKEVVSK